MAKEFDDKAVYAKLMAHAEDNYDPTWDRDSGEFTWGFGLNLRSPIPRGQYNGYMATAEAGSPGAMARIYDGPNLRKVPGTLGLRSGLP